MESIVKHQRDFFEKGVHFLKPMVLREVANDIGVHESTISRVTTNKYVHTPVGTFELKYFFNSGISSGLNNITNTITTNLQGGNNLFTGFVQKYNTQLNKATTQLQNINKFEMTFKR